jgi:hypothetical protein
LDRPIIPIKTAAGQAELGSRQRRVSQRHRTMLLLVDGRRTVEQVRNLSAKAGVPDICFDELVEMGLIAMPAPSGVAPGAHPTPAPVAGARGNGQTSPEHARETGSPFEDEPELPASRTLPPESAFSDTGLANLTNTTSWPETEPVVDETGDEVLERAREILLRAVQKEAPVAGSLTMFRLRRARNRAELEGLLEEVASRIGKPPHTLAAVQVLRRVRNVLEGRDSSPMPL